MRAFFTGIDDINNSMSLKKDPFLLYGPGLFNFLKMILRLVILFTVLSILATI